MNTPPGLTCARCRQRLYPAIARATDDGWVHTGICRRVCQLTDCDRKHHANGYCAEHNRRWKAYGDPNVRVAKVNHDERAEDVRWMAETGECLSGAAARLGMTTDALEVWGRRHDRASLALLIAREPKDHNRIISGFSVAELTGQTARRARRRKVAA